VFEQIHASPHIIGNNAALQNVTRTVSKESETGTASKKPRAMRE